jgi:hypothetical protein
MPPDGLQQLTKVLADIRQLCRAIRDSTPDYGSLDTPAIFEQSASIILSIISPSGADPTILVLRDAALFDTLADEKKQTFVARANALMKNLSERIPGLFARIESVQYTMNHSVSLFGAKTTQVLAELDQEYLAKIDEFKQKYSEDRKVLSEQQKGAFADYQRRLSEQLAASSTEWGQRLQAAEAAITKNQWELHELARPSRERDLLERELLAEEDRRAATEREEVSVEYRAMVGDVALEIDRLMDEKAKIAATIEKNRKDRDGWVAALEEKHLEERRAVEHERRVEMEETERQVDGLKENIRIIEGKRSELPDILARDRKVLDAELDELRSASALELADRAQRFRPELKAKYEEIVDRLTEEHDMYDKKVKDMRSLLRRAAGAAELFLDQVREATRGHMLVREKLRNDKRAKRAELEALIAQKAAELKEFTGEWHQRLAGVVGLYEDTQRAHAQEITSTVKAFQDQQELLVELQREAIQARDRDRADALASLRRAHEQRQKALLESIERQQRAEEEEELRNALNAESDAHVRKISSLQGSIDAIQARLDELRARVSEVQKANVRSTEAIKHETKEREKRRDQAMDASRAIIQEAQRRISHEAEEIHLRRENVVKEADELSSALHTLEAEIPAKIAELQFQYQIEEQMLTTNVNDVRTRHRRLSSNVDQQKLRIQEIEETYIVKATEATQFELQMADATEDYQKQLTREYEESFRLAKEQPVKLTEEIAMTERAFTLEIEEIAACLAAERARAQRISDRVLLERAHAIEQIELASEAEFQARRQYLEAESAKRRELAESNFLDEQQNYTELILLAKTEGVSRIEKLRKEMQQVIAQLEARKAAPAEEQTELDETLEVLLNRECEGCVQSKEILAALKVKHEDLIQKVMRMRQRNGKTDQMLNSIFTGNEAVPRVIARPSTPPRPIIKKPQPARPLNPLEFRF